MKFFIKLLLLFSLATTLGCGEAMRDFLDRGDESESAPSADEPYVLKYGGKFSIGTHRHIGKNSGPNLSVELETGPREQEMSHASGFGGKFSLSENGSTH